MEHRSPRTAAGGLSQRQGMGILFGVYLSFGLSPLYWNLLHGVSALEMVSHRSLWGSLIIAAFMVWKGQFPAFFRAIRDRREIALIGLCSLAHLWNWWIYIWAVTNGKVLECSMGHYIVPMISTILGFLFFRERPGRLQWMGIIFAGIGVLILLMGYGAVPWASLNVSLSAALFAFFRKRATVGAAPGMLMELLFSAPFLWGYLIWLGERGEGHFLAGGAYMDLLRIRLRHSPIGPEPRHPQRADDLAGHHAIHFADYGFHARRIRHARTHIGEQAAGVPVHLGGCWVLPVRYRLFYRKKKAPAGNGNRAGEVLRNEGGIEP